MWDANGNMLDIKEIPIILAKIIGMLVFFAVIKLVLASKLVYFLFGEWFHFILEYYWMYVLAGLIPAILAKYKGSSFWFWWVLGIFNPIITSLFVLAFSRSSTCNLQIRDVKE